MGNGTLPFGPHSWENCCWMLACWTLTTCSESVEKEVALSLEPAEVNRKTCPWVLYWPLVLFNGCLTAAAAYLHCCLVPIAGTTLILVVDRSYAIYLVC